MQRFDDRIRCAVAMAMPNIEYKFLKKAGLARDRARADGVRKGSPHDGTL